jgi:hypothetical protein
MSDAVRCPRVRRGRSCGELLLQLVPVGVGRAVLECITCGYQEVVYPRQPPGERRWKCATLTKPCKVPGCPEVLAVPMSHPNRVTYCALHRGRRRSRAGVAA